jgi:Fe-S oxidoreductase
MDTLAGPFDFLDPRYPVPQHIVEVTHDLIKRGALTLDASANDERRVTFHDSCNIARASRMGDVPGGQFTLPREVLSAVSNHFYEMRDDTIREATFCCGGGGGLLTDDLVELRVKGAMPRMQAMKEVVERHGVTHLVAICAICKSQFAKMLPFYGFEMDQILSLHQLVGDAVVLGDKQ